MENSNIQTIVTFSSDTTVLKTLLTQGPQLFTFSPGLALAGLAETQNNVLSRFWALSAT